MQEPTTSATSTAGTLEENTLRDYYDRIAADYDASRFGNSYGRYIATQERRILQRWLPRHAGAQVLDLACGTGRFLDLATVGLDASAKMLAVARQSHAKQALVHASALSMPFADDRFDAIFSLHLFMHLRPSTVAGVLDECHRVLRPGGVMVFDIPSATRRRMLRFQAQGWHGGTSASLAELKKLTAAKWAMASTSAVLMLPVHRIPVSLRLPLISLDDLLCRSWLKSMASHLFLQLRKPVAEERSSK